MFKQGDRVRRVKPSEYGADPNEFAPVGATGTIVRPDDTFPEVMWDEPLHRSPAPPAGDLEPIDTDTDDNVWRKKAEVRYQWRNHLGRWCRYDNGEIVWLEGYAGESWLSRPKDAVGPRVKITKKPAKSLARVAYEAYCGGNGWEPSWNHTENWECIAEAVATEVRRRDAKCASK